MDLARLRVAVRFDSGWWRRFAELGCVYSPEWWKRGSPPVIAAIIYSIARDQRAAVLRNQRQVRGSRGVFREGWDAYRVFAECARSMTESFEQWGPRPPRIVLEVPELDVFRAALAEGRGLVIPTAHFGGWEVGARFLSDLGRPVNLVTAHEPNPGSRFDRACPAGRPPRFITGPKSKHVVRQNSPANQDGPTGTGINVQLG